MGVHTKPLRHDASWAAPCSEPREQQPPGPRAGLCLCGLETPMLGVLAETPLGQPVGRDRSYRLSLWSPNILRSTPQRGGNSWARANSWHFGKVIEEQKFGGHPDPIQVRVLG